MRAVERSETALNVELIFARTEPGLHALKRRRADGSKAVALRATPLIRSAPPPPFAQGGRGEAARFRRALAPIASLLQRFARPGSSRHKDIFTPAYPFDETMDGGALCCA